MNTTDLIEVLGALLILIAFAATQLRRLDAHSTRYLVLNVIGAGILAGIAATERSWGFLLLEGTWTVVSLISLVGTARRGGGDRRRGGSVSRPRRVRRPARPPARPA